MKLLIIDLETISLKNKPNKIAEIGAVLVDLNTGEKKILMDEVIKADFSEVDKHNEPWIIKHGYMSREEIESGKNLEEVRDELQTILYSYPVTAYNSLFDFKHLEANGFEIPITATCLMYAAKYVIKEKNNKGRIKNCKAEKAYQVLMNKPDFIEDHRAASDALIEADIAYILHKDHNKISLQFDMHDVKISRKGNMYFNRGNNTYFVNKAHNEY